MTAHMGVYWFRRGYGGQKKRAAALNRLNNGTKNELTTTKT